MKIFEVTKYFLISYLRHYEVWFSVFAFPVLLFLLLSSIFPSFENEETLNIKVGIYKEEELTGISKMIFSFIEKGKIFEVVNIKDLDEGKRLLRSKKVDGIIVFPKGFSKNLLSSIFGNKKAKLKIYVRSGSENSRLFESVIKAIISEINSKIAIYGKKEIKVSVIETVSPRNFKYKDYFFPGILVGSIFSAAMFIILPIIIFNRYTGINKRIFITPMNSIELFFGYIISVIIVIFMSIILLYLIGYIMKVNSIIYSPGFIILTLYSGMISITFALLLASFIKYPQTANVLGNLFYFLLTFFGGSYFNVYDLPKPLNLIVLLNPLTHVIEMMRNLLGMKFTPYSYPMMQLIPALYLICGIFLFVVNYKKVMGYE